MEAGFEKQIPTGHPYIEAFNKYRNDLFGANRLTIVVRAKHGTIWTKDGLQRLYQVTQKVTLLPFVDRPQVQSLWTPNSFVNEITEEGFRAEPVIPGTVAPDNLTDAEIQNIRQTTERGGFTGLLVSRDNAGAMITASLNEVAPDGTRLDYITYSHLLEEQIRKPFEDQNFEIQIIGFAKQIGDIADGASSVLEFCIIAIFLTGVAVYWYAHSLRLTILPLVCSLTSLVWQFGTLHLLGYGLDPLGVLVPFLVFAIGVSHGVQQINYIVREIAEGRSTMDAARASFTGLLIPGVLALVTAFVTFITLTMVPIPMIKELAITAALGVLYKIVTNLVMLPVAASCFNFTKEFAEKAMLNREKRAGWLRILSHVARPRNAVLVLIATSALFGVAIWQSQDRVVGTLQPGAPELRPESRFNLDAVSITNNFDVGLDWLSIMLEAPPGSCSNPNVGLYGDALAVRMRSVPGVVSISSYAGQLRTYNEGYNEGFPKMWVVPVDPVNYGALSSEISRVRGYTNSDCSMTAVHLFLSDHKAVTINRVTDAVKAFAAEHPDPEVKVLLAGGNAGILAATNDMVEHSELPMMLYVYAVIIIQVLLAYRDPRAVIACCLPLTVGTFIGYWFMKEFDIGLTVATLPVMVLAVGIGVDYAFYIYNRLQLHLAHGEPMAVAVEKSLLEVGMATIFTAITLAVGVSTWAFSDLKFQADMGKLLSFMFIVNLVMAMTALPALAVVLEKLFPRTHPVKAQAFLNH